MSLLSHVPYIQYIMSTQCHVLHRRSYTDTTHALHTQTKQNKSKHAACGLHCVPPAHPFARLRRITLSAPAPAPSHPSLPPPALAPATPPHAAGSRCRRAGSRQTADAACRPCALPCAVVEAEAAGLVARARCRRWRWRGREGGRTDGAGGVPIRARTLTCINFSALLCT